MYFSFFGQNSSFFSIFTVKRLNFAKKGIFYLVYFDQPFQIIILQNTNFRALSDLQNMFWFLRSKNTETSTDTYHPHTHSLTQ